MTTANTILIGDLHGCATEFRALLSRLSPSATDRIVLLGDLVNKGPDPVGVFETFESLGCICLRGNHENDHLHWQAGYSRPKPESEVTAQLMAGGSYPRYLEAAARMPFFYENSNLIAVHGGVLNGIPLSAQPKTVLTGETNLDPSWKDHLDLDRPLVAGHKRYHADQSIPFIIAGKFYGLDTGCVYGGCLTALIMPERRIVQVRAARNYSEG